VPTQRKGTLSGVPPPPTYAGFGDDEFDAERTMVVDPDDAPTADYDPRMGAPYASMGGQQPITDIRRPEGLPPEIPAPRPSGRRTSRRTVKIPEDPVRRKERPAPVTVEDPPQAADGQLGASGLYDATPQEIDDGPDSMPDGPRGMYAADGSEFTEEITVVKPLRIIDVGADPPPPIRSAFATWPPTPRFDERPIEAGWTPAAPDVIEAGPIPVPGAPQPADDIPHAVDDEPPTPVAPPVAFDRPPPRPLMTSAPDIVVDHVAAEHVSVDPAADREEILEEIEPDAAPIVAPKRPPPPPPKKVETKPEPRDDRDSRPKAWFEDIFSDEYLRTHDRPDAALVRREVDFIEESLAVEKHAVVLDLACGMGDHTNELAARGYSVVGFDLSSGMLDIAKRGAKRRLAADPGFTAPNFTLGDMRDMTYEEAFDGVYCWSTSFGYFEDDKNLAVLAKVHRALRQGGMFLLDVVNRDYVAPRSPSLVWFEGTQCVCMDDMFVDFFNSRLRVKRTAMFEGGLSRELDYSIRLYSLSELGRMLKEVGFKVVEVTGHTSHPGVFFGTESPRLIILAERS